MKDFFSALLQMVSDRIRNGELSMRWIAMGAVGACLLVFLTCAMFRTSPEDLLDAQSLSEKQVRQIATELLLHEDPTIRERAAAKLTSAGMTAAPVLKDLSLNTDDPRLREAVLGVLLNVDQETVVMILETLIASPDAEVRRVAVRFASHCADPRATALLTRALQDTDSGVRLAAANGLSMHRSREGISALEQALNDESPTVRRHAARTLQNITGRDYSRQTPSPQR